MFLQFTELGLELLYGGGSEIGHLYIAYSRRYHIRGINRIDRYLVAYDGEMRQAIHATAYYSKVNLGAARAAQTLHDVLL